MLESLSRQWTLASRPEGYPVMENFALVESPIKDPDSNELLIQTMWLSLDPYMRGRMAAARSYAEPVSIGGVMEGTVVGRVVESRAAGFAPGDIVEAPLGWRDRGVVNAQLARKVDASLAPVSTALGVLGMPGLTAYFGLLEVGRAKPGEVVVVSAASGAVGAVVGQIALLMGCTVIGTAGSDEKVAYIVDELGFDASINYKTQDVEASLRSACPEGVDVYFRQRWWRCDGRRHAPDPLSSAGRHMWSDIAVTHLAQVEFGPRTLRYLLTNQARMEGFLGIQLRGPV